MLDAQLPAEVGTVGVHVVASVGSCRSHAWTTRVTAFHGLFATLAETTALGAGSLVLVFVTGAESNVGAVAVGVFAGFLQTG